MSFVRLIRSLLLMVLIHHDLSNVQIELEYCWDSSRTDKIYHRMRRQQFSNFGPKPAHSTAQHWSVCCEMKVTRFAKWCKRKSEESSEVTADCCFRFLLNAKHWVFYNIHCKIFFVALKFNFNRWVFGGFSSHPYLLSTMLSLDKTTPNFEF